MHELRELGRSLDHLLQVVEKEEHLPLADVRGESVPRSERLRDRLRHERGLAEGGESDPEDTRLVRRDELGRSFQSEASLPRAAWPGEREQARPSAELAHNLFPLSLATDERARGPGKVRVRDRLERREALVAELVDRDRALDVLQAVFPEVGDREPLDELASRLREQDLTTVARGCDTRREVHVVSHVALVGDERGARVQADAQADLAPVRERP